MPRRILAATDGSDHALKALDLAVELSAKLPAELVILHVHMHGRPVEELARMAEVEHLVAGLADPAQPPVAGLPGSLQSLLAAKEDQMALLNVTTRIGDMLVARARERAEDGGARTVRTRVAAGDYADAILEAAEDEGAEMIVMGCRGLGQIRGLLQGSVSHKVAQHAACTVVTVK